jgi:hypothetical protein
VYGCVFWVCVDCECGIGVVVVVCLEVLCCVRGGVGFHCGLWVL